MRHLFIIIAIVATLMTTLAGAGIFYFSQSATANAQRDAAINLAKGAANIMSTRVALLDNTLQKMAHSPELIAAIEQSDLLHAKTLYNKWGATFLMPWHLGCYFLETINLTHQSHRIWVMLI